MPFSNWILMLGVGKLLIFTGMSFPLPAFLHKYPNIVHWHECGFCFGVWVYTVLSLAFGFDLLNLIGLKYIFLLSNLITGATLSFLVHLLSLGWTEYFAPVVEI